MQKISDSTSSADSAGEFTEGSPAGGVPATQIKARWLNAVQRELLNLITGSGLAKDSADDGQVYKAVLRIAKAAADFGSIGNKPTTLSGYGITDAYTKTQTDTLLAGKAAKSTTVDGYGIADAFYSGMSLSDYSAMSKSGMYKLGSGATLNKPEGWSGSLALNMDYTDYSITLAGNLGSDDMAFRRKSTNGYGPWRTLWHSGNFDPTSKADKGTTLAAYGITDAATKTELGTKAPLASPTFTGTPKVPTAPVGDNSLHAANTAFVQLTVAALVASSPAALDTLKELADAINNDPNFATTMLNALAGKANKATTLGGYGITDGATKTEVNAKVDSAGAAEVARDIGFRARASLPPATSGVNFNAIVTPGCHEYIVYGTHANGPGVAAYFYVEVYEYGGNTLTQRLIPYTAKGGTYTRNRYDGVWSDWDKDVTEYTLPSLIPTATGSRAGILKLNHSITSDDQATAASSYALKLVRDLAYNKGSPNTASLLANGWSKDNDTGEIEQWGVVTGVADNTLVNVTFPIAFPVECLNGSTTFASDPGTSGSDITGFISPTRTGFTLRVSGNNTTNSVYWRAKGR